MAFHEESLYEALWSDIDPIEFRSRTAAASWVSDASKNAPQNQTQNQPHMQPPQLNPPLQLPGGQPLAAISSAMHQRTFPRSSMAIASDNPHSLPEPEVTRTSAPFPSDMHLQPFKPILQPPQPPQPPQPIHQPPHAPYESPVPPLAYRQHNFKHEPNGHWQSQFNPQSTQRFQLQEPRRPERNPLNSSMGPSDGSYIGTYSAFPSFPAPNAPIDLGPRDRKDVITRAFHEYPSQGPPSLLKERTSMGSSVTDDINGIGPNSDMTMGFSGDTGATDVVGMSVHGGQTFPNCINTDTATSSSAPPLPRIARGTDFGSVVKQKQRRRYAKPKPSKYCHLCARHERAVRMYPCGNLELGVCQKSVCEKCFTTNGLDITSAKMPRGLGRSRWTCPHCQNACPKKAKCHSYDRQTERRRMKTREAKRLAMLVGREATSA